MKADGEKRDTGRSRRDPTMTSQELIKEAWTSMGRAETGDRLEEPGVLPSGAMAAAAASAAAGTRRENGSAQLLATEMGRRGTTVTEPRSGRPETGSARPATSPQPIPPPPAPLRPRRSTRSPAPAPPPTVPQPVGEPPGRSRRFPRGTGWLILAAIWAIGALVGVFFEDSSVSVPDVTETAPASTIAPSTANEANIRDLEPGTCIATLPLGQVVTSVPTLPCAEPHQYELFANAELALGNDYPGSEEVFDRAFDTCGALFFDYVGEAYATSEWYVDVIAPTEEGWDKLNDRQVNCLLYLWDEDASEVRYVTGTAAGSGAAGT